MTAPQEAGAYEPRPGDWVTVRRYIQPTTGKRTLSAERAGQITNVHPQAGGYRIWLDGDPEWIFTGYQFLGQGTDGKGPASLVTEVTPANRDGLRIQLTPDLAVLLDASQCIVLEVTDPAAGGEVLRRITVTDVNTFKAALHDVREAQRAVLALADIARYEGIDEKRAADGRLTRREAVEWLIAKGPMSRQRAVTMTGELRAGAAGGPLALGMAYDGTHWIVPGQPGTDGTGQA